MLLAAPVLSAGAPALTAFLANTTTPPGGTTQLQLFLSTPQTLASGGASIDLDPAIFNNILAADVYSATGDQIGIANIQGRHLDIEFRSQTGGIGRLPYLPVLTITVPVLATATVGATFSLPMRPGTTGWLDIQGVQYYPSITSGTFTVGGSLSVSNVAIVGGMLPSGSPVEIDGTGFTNATTVQIDGVAISSTEFVSPQKLIVTLSSTADLTFRRVVLQNALGAPVTIFPVLHGSYIQHPSTGDLATIQPIFPLQLFPAANTPGFVVADGGLALQNPSNNTVNINLSSATGSGAEATVSLPPGASYFQAGSALNAPYNLAIIPSSPIRMARIGSTIFVPVTAMPVPPTTVLAYLNGTSQPAGPLTWNWTVGASAPSPKPLAILGASIPFTVAVTTATGGNWLSASPLQGVTCLGGPPAIINSCPPPGLITVTTDPTHLAAGTYTGSVTITPQGQNPLPLVIPVVFNIYAQPIFFSNGTAINISTNVSGNEFLQITSSADPLAFTAIASTQSSQNWLTVTPSQGTTPAILIVGFNLAALNGQSDVGGITIKGASTALVIPVSFSRSTPTSVRIISSPAALQFTVQLGQPAPSSQMISVPPAYDPFTVAAQTVTGGNWLSASVRKSPGVPAGIVSVNPAGLAAGTYTGAVTLTSPIASIPAEVPVTLTVWSGDPPPVTIDIASISLTAQHGTSTSQTIHVTTGDLPLPFGASAVSAGGGNWLRAVAVVTDVVDPLTPPTTPGTVVIGLDATSIPPGTYTGTATITAPPGSSNSISLPVTFTVTPEPQPLPQTGTVPLAATVVNAASEQQGSLSPGEILSIFGQNIGPAVPLGFALGPDGKVATSLGGTQVLFDGVAAPLLYVSASQLNVIVPHSTNTTIKNNTVNIAVEYSGASIPLGDYLITASAPGLFTRGSTGQGAAAVLNQDNSINSIANPAVTGSVIQIFGTGEGVTSPPGVTGELTGSDTKRPVLPVSVSIGGIETAIMYAGSAPDAVSGLFQINAVVPQSIGAGSSVPLKVIIGTAASQTNTTISVK